MERPTPDPISAAELAAERIDYAGQPLREAEVPSEPYALFDRWLGDAFAARDAGRLHEPTAMVVATNGDGRPSARTVLLKEVDRHGFVFFTNYDSRKATELATDPWAALHFGWYALQRQVRVEGRATHTSRADSEAYFASRPRGSQLGAWASAQSSEVGSVDELEETYAAAERRFAGQDVPCPPHWGGIRVVPELVEFWQGRPSRMHDRLVYGLTGGGWSLVRLAP